MHLIWAANLAGLSSAIGIPVVLDIMVLGSLVIHPNKKSGIFS
jgi:hypothetical protein